MLGNQELVHRPSSRVCSGNLQELLQRSFPCTCCLMVTILEVGTVRQSAGSGADLVDVCLVDGQNQAISAIAHGSAARDASLVPGMYFAIYGAQARANQSRNTAGAACLRMFEDTYEGQSPSTLIYLNIP